MFLSVRKTIENETKKLDTDEYFQAGSTPNESMQLRQRQRRQESASWRLQRVLHLTKRRLQMENVVHDHDPTIEKQESRQRSLSPVSHLWHPTKRLSFIRFLFSPKKQLPFLFSTGDNSSAYLNGRIRSGSGDSPATTGIFETALLNSTSGVSSPPRTF